jgi:hypothetical protein
VEPDILAGFQNIGEEAKKLNDELSSIGPELLKYEKSKEFLNQAEHLRYYLFDTKHKMEAVADKLQTREEHNLEMKIKNKKYKEALEMMDHES